MSIKTDALIIRDETVDGANTALRVGQNLSDIADDLIAKQSALNLLSEHDHPLVEEAVPLGAIFTDTDTVYDDTAIQAAVALNTAKETNIAHPLVETAVPIGAVFTDTDTIYDDTAVLAAIAINTAKDSNIAHPLVEKAVPSNAVFTDTVYDDSAIQAAVALNTAKDLTTKQDALVSGVNIKTINGESLLGGTDIIITGSVYDDADVLKDADTLSPVTGINKLMTQSDVAGLGGGDMLSSTYDPIINANTAKVSNVDHPLVETAVPVGAVFTDTVYDDTAIQGEVDANTAKVGITTAQANDIISNNAKISYTDSAAVAANTAKVTYPSADSTKLGLIEAGATNDNTATIQTKRPLKTINGTSLEGSGDIVVAGGGQPDVVVEDLAVTGTKTINWNSGETYRLTLTGAVVLSDSNLVSVGKSEIITLYVDGDFALTLPTGWDTYKTGTYDGTVLNTITVEYVNATTPFHKVTIIQ